MPIFKKPVDHSDFYAPCIPNIFSPDIPGQNRDAKIVAWAGSATITHFAENVRKLALSRGDFGMLNLYVLSLFIL